MIFKSIHLEVSLAHGMLLLNTIIANNKNRIATKIPLIGSIPKVGWKFQLVLSMLMNANTATNKNKYRKFLILGTETSMASSVGDSFFIIK